MRKALLLAAFLGLVSCSRPNQDRESIRQGVLEHLSKAGLTTANLDIQITDLKVKGGQADAEVAITPRGSPPSEGMKMRYGLQEQNGKWIVTSRADSSGMGHGAVPPGSPNPHAGAVPPDASSPGAKMPSPEDLPPARKK